MKSTHRKSHEPLSASLEDYLKTIALVVDEKRAARPKDISERMDVGMSSVTGALRALSDRDLVNYEPYEMVTLTERGRRAADEVVRRNAGIREFLVKVLALDEAVACEAACQLEHAVSPVVLERFVRFVEYMEMCPRIGSNWTEQFGYHCDHPDHGTRCDRCMTVVVDEPGAPGSDVDRGAVVSLNGLVPGSRGRIVRVTGRGETRRRIVDMGMTPGTLIEVERIAPLGDPMEVKVKGYHLSLRREEAGRISVLPE